MVVLKVVVWLILEQEYQLHGERAKAKKLFETVKDPENTLVGQFVIHLRNRYRKTFNEDLQVKYIKEAQDDADIDPENSMADVFVDYGRAETDKADQRASMKLIRKTVEGGPLRAGSVVPDLSLPHFQQPISRRPPVPTADFGPPAPVLGKRTNIAAFGVDSTPQPPRPLAQIAEEDHPVSSIEREEGPASPEIPESNLTPTNTQRQFAVDDDEPKSESDDERQVPSTFPLTQVPISTQNGDSLGETQHLPSDDASIQALSRPPSASRDVNQHNSIRKDISRPRPLLQDETSSQDNYGSGQSRTADDTLTALTVSKTPQSKFLNGEGKLFRPKRAFNSPAAFTKTISQQGKRNADAFEVPESEIEDSQQDPAQPVTKRRRVSKKGSSSSASTDRNRNRELDSLLRSTPSLVAEGSKRSRNIPNYAYVPSIERADPATLSQQAHASQALANSASEAVGAEIGKATSQNNDDHLMKDPMNKELLPTGVPSSVGIPDSGEADMGMPDISAHGEQPSAIISRANSASRHAESDKENSRPNAAQPLTAHNTEASARANLDVADITVDGGREVQTDDKGVPTGLNVLQEVKGLKSGLQKSTGKKVSLSRLKSSGDKLVAMPASGVPESSNQTSKNRQMSNGQSRRGAATPVPAVVASEEVIVTDGEAENPLGLGITQSPSRRRTSSVVDEQLAEANGKSPSVSSTKPIPKGKKARRTSAINVASIEPAEEATTPVARKQTTQRKSLFGNSNTKSDLPIQGAASESAPDPALGGGTHDKQKPGSKKSSSSVSRKVPNVTSDGRVMPDGMSEEEYNRQIENFKLGESSNSQAKRGKRATQKPSSTNREISSDKVSPIDLQDAHNSAANSKDQRVAATSKGAGSRKEESIATNEPENVETNTIDVKKSNRTKKVAGIKDGESVHRNNQAKKDNTSAEAERQPSESITGALTPKGPSHDVPSVEAMNQLPGSKSGGKAIAASRSQSTNTNKTQAGKASSLSLKPASAPKTTSSKSPDKSTLQSTSGPTSAPKTTAPTSKPKSPVVKPPLSSVTAGRPTNLTTLKQQQAAERREREEKEKQARKQAAASKVGPAVAKKSFGLLDESSSSDSDSDDSSSEDLATELSLPMKNKYDPEKSKSVTSARKHSFTEVKEKGDTPSVQKSKTLNASSFITKQHNITSSRPHSVQTLNSTTKPLQPNTISSSSSSSGSDASSSSSDSDSESGSEQGVGSKSTTSPNSFPAGASTLPVGSASKTKPAPNDVHSLHENPVGTAATAAVEEEDDSETSSSGDDTDIVKEDNTPPPSQAKKLLASQASSSTTVRPTSKWGIGNLKLFGR